MPSTSANDETSRSPAAAAASSSQQQQELQPPEPAASPPVPPPPPCDACAQTEAFATDADAGDASKTGSRRSRRRGGSKTRRAGVNTLKKVQERRLLGENAGGGEAFSLSTSSSSSTATKTTTSASFDSKPSSSSSSSSSFASASASSGSYSSAAARGEPQPALPVLPDIGEVEEEEVEARPRSGAAPSPSPSPLLPLQQQQQQQQQHREYAVRFFPSEDGEGEGTLLGGGGRGGSSGSSRRTRARTPSLAGGGGVGGGGFSSSSGDSILLRATVRVHPGPGAREAPPAAGAPFDSGGGGSGGGLLLRRRAGGRRREEQPRRGLFLLLPLLLPLLLSLFKGEDFAHCCCSFLEPGGGVNRERSSGEGGESVFSRFGEGEEFFFHPLFRDIVFFWPSPSVFFCLRCHCEASIPWSLFSLSPCLPARSIAAFHSRGLDERKRRERCVLVPRWAFFRFFRRRSLSLSLRRKRRVGETAGDSESRRGKKKLDLDLRLCLQTKKKEEKPRARSSRISLSRSFILLFSRLGRGAHRRLLVPLGAFFSGKARGDGRLGRGKVAEGQRLAREGEREEEAGGGGVWSLGLFCLALFLRRLVLLVLLLSGKGLVLLLALWSRGLLRRGRRRRRRRSLFLRLLRRLCRGGGGGGRGSGNGFLPALRLFRLRLLLLILSVDLHFLDLWEALRDLGRDPRDQSVGLCSSRERDSFFYQGKRGKENPLSGFFFSLSISRTSDFFISLFLYASSPLIGSHLQERFGTGDEARDGAQRRQARGGGGAGGGGCGERGSG